MADTIVDSIYNGVFHIIGETTPTLDCFVYDHNDALVATKTVVYRNAGYLFSHVFTNTGVYFVKVVSSFGVSYFDTIQVKPSIWTEGGADSLVSNITDIKDMTMGRWKVDTTLNRMIFYATDNVTIVAQYDLKDAAGNAVSTSVFERIRVT